MPTQNQIEIKKYITPELKKRMTNWEKEFITSLYNRKEDFTPKQVDVFNNIKKKYQLTERIIIERIIYAPEGYTKGAKYHQDITTRNMRKNRSTGRKRP
jgi:hypothetical protein